MLDLENGSQLQLGIRVVVFVGSRLVRRHLSSKLNRGPRPLHAERKVSVDPARKFHACLPALSLSFVPSLG